MAAQTIIPDRASIDVAIHQARQDMIDAYTANRIDVFTYQRWQKAIDKAEQRLQGRGWAWNGSVLVVRSSDGMTQYRVTAGACECVAFVFHNKPCCHRATRKVIVNALAIEAASFTSKVEQTIRISPAEAAVDALNELATDADFVAMQDALNAEFGL